MLHDPGCRNPFPEHTDAAKRVSDIYNMHLTAGSLYGTSNVGKHIAVALADGKSDNTLYDSHYDAIIHQHHNEEYYGFIRINPSSMSPCQAEGFLRAERIRYDARIKTADRNHPQGGYQIIPRLNLEDQELQNELIRTRSGKIAIGLGE